MTTDPGGLLDELAALRKRARTDRHGYWFPLLLMGVLSVGSLPFSRTDPNPTDHLVDGRASRWFDPLAHLRLNTEVLHPLALELYWAGALITGVVATVWWYRSRARRVGVETPTGTYVQVALLGSFAALIGIPLSTTLFYEYSTIYPTLPVVIVVMAVLLGLAVLAFRARRARPLFIVAGLVLTSMALSLLQVPDVGVDLGTGGMAQFTVIAFGVLTLAWVERSALCGVIAVVFAASVLIVNNSPMEIDALGAAQDVLPPATVLLLGGLGALAAHRSPS
ncbi:hypothetical protein SAMN05216188_10738 [Lentzea xinjiangensis]|uniref:Uncharacterized protein n=1 Tax=Lentzea xinjiangensis TaxID=402600 RepID=A0A1H9KMP7_9PSEU|nr:hypothetical protein [Lentzea xinjiangensis]SER00441.1 hypothetical protein SAMN05216188_10738 [Lentzea xinjiangensis]